MFLTLYKEKRGEDQERKRGTEGRPKGIDEARQKNHPPERRVEDLFQNHAESNLEQNVNGFGERLNIFLFFVSRDFFECITANN